MHKDLHVVVVDDVLPYQPHPRMDRGDLVGQYLVAGVGVVRVIDLKGLILCYGSGRKGLDHSGVVVHLIVGVEDVGELPDRPGYLVVYDSLSHGCRPGRLCCPV